LSAAGRRRRQRPDHVPDRWLGVPSVASDGHPVFSSEVWNILASSLGWSDRESQIVPALLDDLKEAAIAARLGISRHTVHTHTERLYRKMGITSRVGLVRRVFLEYLSLVRRHAIRRRLPGRQPQSRLSCRRPQR